MSINEEAILRGIRAQYALAWDGLHGVAHWARVLENGLLIAEHTGVHPDLVLLFALFHDACRMNDAVDPGHGLRGAELAAGYRGMHYELPDDDFALLYEACSKHTDGLTDGHPVLQTCWDADRLDLARAKITPSPEQMCTEVAKDAEVIAWATERSLQGHFPPQVKARWRLSSESR